MHDQVLSILTTCNAKLSEGLKWPEIRTQEEKIERELILNERTLDELPPLEL